MEAKTWGIYHNGEGLGTVEATSEAEALHKVALERGFKNVDDAQAESSYWVEELDA